MVRFQGPDGEIVEQPVRYKWMPCQCGVCGWWGHKAERCTAGRASRGMPEMAWKKKGIPSRAPTGIPNAVAEGSACNDLAVRGLDQTVPGGVGKTQNARNSGVGVVSAFNQLQTLEAFNLAEHKVPPNIC
ncbi:hypothetical protein Dimus_020069, partial [Dionaea muscipula]